MDLYRVILADDHMMFRLGIRKILETMPTIEVVGEADDGYELLRILPKYMPDMVILDISMPKIRGIEATREIKTLYPRIKIVILTMHKNMEYLQHSIGAGADAYIVKQDAGKELFAAIKAVRNNEIYISPVFSVSLTSDFIRKCRGETSLEEDPLTPRQREVIKLIAEGKTNKEIADLLFLSTRTVEKHRAKVMERLDLRTTADLVKYAIKKKYIFLEN